MLIVASVCFRKLADEVRLHSNDGGGPRWYRIESERAADFRLVAGSERNFVPHFETTEEMAPIGETQVRSKQFEQLTRETLPRSVARHMIRVATTKDARVFGRLRVGAQAQRFDRSTQSWPHDDAGSGAAAGRCSTAFVGVMRISLPATTAVPSMMRL